MRRTNKKINEEEEEACVYIIVSTKISSNLPRDYSLQQISHKRVLRITVINSMKQHMI